LRLYRGLRLVAEDEVVRFAGHVPQGTRGWLHHHGLELCKAAEACVEAFVGNKVSAAIGPPTFQDTRNVLPFRAVLHVGFDVGFRF
jgi:hypothetical protein